MKNDYFDSYVSIYQARFKNCGRFFLTFPYKIVVFSKKKVKNRSFSKANMGLTSGLNIFFILKILKKNLKIIVSQKVTIILSYTKFYLNLTIFRKIKLSRFLDFKIHLFSI